MTHDGDGLDEARRAPERSRRTAARRYLVVWGTWTTMVAAVGAVTGWAWTPWVAGIVVGVCGFVAAQVAQRFTEPRATAVGVSRRTVMVTAVVSFVVAATLTVVAGSGIDSLLLGTAAMFSTWMASAWLIGRNGR